MGHPLVGTVVKLISGGPEMTILDIERSDDLISVAWFSGTELRRDVFEKDALVRQATPEELAAEAMAQEQNEAAEPQEESEAIS